MFCKHCGNQLPDNVAYCGNCGAKIEVEDIPQPAYEAPQPAYEAPQQPTYVAPTQPVYQASSAELNDLAGSILGKGIAGLALGFVGIPGIIVSNIAMRQAEEFQRKAGSLYGKAKVGRRLAKPGLIVGIAMTAFYVLYAIVLLAMG